MKNIMHGKKTERLEVRLDSFDKMYLVAMANKKGVSIGHLFRDMLRDYKDKNRSSMSDDEYKDLLNYMLILSQD